MTSLKEAEESILTGVPGRVFGYLPRALGCLPIGGGFAFARSGLTAARSPGLHGPLLSRMWGLGRSRLDELFK